MRPGEVHRWRLIHGGVRENIKLRLEQHSLYRIARDGISTGELESDNAGKDAFELAPGNRCDVLVKANQLTGEASHDFLLIDAAMPAKDTLLGDPKAPNVLAVVRVIGTSLEMPMPKAEDLEKFRPFPKEPIPDEKITGVQVANFSLEFRPSDGAPQFLINGRSFDKAFSRRLPLGATERWVVSSTFVNHPFHIHTNPFQVAKVLVADTTAPPSDDPDIPRGYKDTFIKPYWCDTILVKEGQRVLLNMTYADYVGRFVLHCHILDHEDQGMMELVEIIP